ncbi:MAG: DnaJ C-terminal domain-containing protein [Hyphomicrobiaceae bacterium]
MADDPYKILGLERSASEDDIRRAFRRLAKELHPDLRPGDAAGAERFKKITVAYDLLSDPDKRRRFDAGEIDGMGEPQQRYARQGAGAGAGGGRDPGFGDIFADLFGDRRGRGPQGGFSLRGQDVRYTLEVEFLEAALGARKRVTLPEGGVLDLSVPEGVTDGQVLRLKGKGTPGLRGGEAGDALVEIRVRPHAEFRREGNDILLDLPIGLAEAVLGAKIEVQTISGRVTLTIPKGTSSGRAFRLKGRGVKSGSLGVAGDQLVTVRIVLPDTIDDSLAYFLTEWRKKNAYVPRR